MKTHSNWSSNTNNLSDFFYTKEETIASVQSNFDFRRYYTTEGKSVSIDGTTERVLIQDHTNPLNADKVDKKLHTTYDSVIKYGSNVILDDNSVWLVISNPKDIDGAYVSAKIEQCNYTLKFQNSSGNILSYPAIFKSSPGELDKNNMITIPDGKASIKLRFYQPDTNNLVIGKRLIIDNRTSISNPNTYKIADAVVTSYDATNGILTLTLEKDEFNSSTDSLTYWVCDYFSNPVSSGSAEILYSGNCELKSGGVSKLFMAVFKDSEGTVLSLTPIWSHTAPTGYEAYVTATTVSGEYKVKVLDNENLIGESVVISVTEGTGTYSAVLTVPIVSL